MYQPGKTAKKTGKGEQESRKATGEQKTSPQKTANAGSPGNGSETDFKDLVAKAHVPEAEDFIAAAAEEDEEINIPEAGKEKATEEKGTGEREYTPFAVLPKGMVKQIAAFPFAGIENLLRPFYPGMPVFYLTENEAEELADPLDAVLWEYSPVLLSKYGALFSLGFAMSMMIIRKAGWTMAPKQILTVPDDENVPSGEAGFGEKA